MIVSIERADRRRVRPTPRRVAMSSASTTRPFSSPPAPPINVWPVIDPGGCAPAAREAIGRDIIASCRSLGYFSITVEHPEAEHPDELSRAVRRLSAGLGAAMVVDVEPISLSDCERWFAQEPSVKEARAMVDGRGYQRLHENVTENKPDAHEALDFYRACAKREPGTLRGPHRDMGDGGAMNARVEARARGMLRLGRALLRCVALALQLSEDAFEDDVAGCPFWIMRLIHSPGRASDDEDVLSCGAHTDYGFLTFLEATHAGLQVEDAGSKEWRDVPLARDSFVCLIGEMMQLFTGDVLKATRHRVVRKRDSESAAESRYSIAFFYEPNYDAVIDDDRRVSWRDGDHRDHEDDSCLKKKHSRPPSDKIRRVAYSAHLEAKVASNFATN